MIIAKFESKLQEYGLDRSFIQMVDTSKTLLVKPLPSTVQGGPDVYFEALKEYLEYKKSKKDLDLMKKREERINRLV